ncbi:MAG: alpha/beta fold hydrolase [Pseudonocardiaceae bacterium]
MGATMERVSVNGVELEFDSAGSGEAVVFIHGGGVADSYLPLAAEPAVRDHYRVIRYRRRGHAGSTPVEGMVSVAEHAHDCRALLGALDVPQAHVVGPEQADNDGATLFESDLASIPEWRFGAEEAVEITQPVLFLSGAESLPAFIESRDLFHSWCPRTEDDVMPGANHLLHMRHPADAAARLTGFLKRHAVTA